MDEIIISVIVPTYKDLERTKECIASLSKQTLDSSRYEIIIADNNPEVFSYGDLPHNALLIHVPKPGSYSARNEALKLVKGKYIAFTDSDCIVSPNWLENGIRSLKDSGGRVGGKITLYDSDNRGDTFSACYEKVFSFNQREYVRNGFSVTANLFIFREHISLVGTFDDALFSGGDVEWNKRAQLLNIPIVFADDVEVFHPIRSSMSDILKKRKRVIGGVYKNLTCKDYFRFLMPPLRTIGDLRSRNDLTTYQSVAAWLVFYYLKIVSFILAISYRTGVISPNRS